MEGRKNIGIGCEDEIDVFSSDFDPSIHSMRSSAPGEYSSCGFSTAVPSESTASKKVMKTANFGTINTIYEDEEEEIITTSKPKYENSGVYTEACDPETNTILVGPDFDNDPYFQQFQPKDAMIGTSDENEYLQNNIVSLLADFRLGALLGSQSDNTDLSSKIENVQAPVDKYRNADSEHSIAIGTDTCELSEASSVTQSTKYWDKEYGIDETDFRVSTTLDKWEEEANTKLFNQINKQTQQEEAEEEDQNEDQVEDQVEDQEESQVEYYSESNEHSDAQTTDSTKVDRSVDYTNEISLTYTVGEHGIENIPSQHNQFIG